MECGQAFRWSSDGEWYCGTVGTTALMVRIANGGLECRSSPNVSPSFVRHYFRLDEDLDAILSDIDRDAHVHEAIRRYRGLRLLRQDPWECLISFVSSAASNVPKISRCIEKMSAAHGQSLSLEGLEFHGFPTPEALSRATEPSLRKCELGFRAGYIAGIARRVAKGELDPYSLAALPYDEAKKELMSLKGVGEKVADCVLLFSMDKLEAFPVDRWVKRVAERLFFRGRKLSEKKVRQWGMEHYGRNAGYAQQYLFHYMRHREE